MGKINKIDSTERTTHQNQQESLNSFITLRTCPHIHMYVRHTQSDFIMGIFYFHHFGYYFGMESNPIESY